MIRYVLKRLLQLIPVLIGLTFVIFALINLAPGDPGSAILGSTAPPEAIQAFNESVGYYDPFFVRYGRFLLGLFRFDFGLSYASGSPVTAEILERFPLTLKIATYSMLFAVVIGVPLGVLSAVKQYSILDEVSRVISVALAAVPSFWLALVMISTFAVKLKILPSYGATSWKHFVLPIVALGLPYAARELRMTRSCMLETIRQDYVRTVRAKGAKEQRVIWKHAFKNALLPVVTQVGSHFGVLIGGAIVTETVFSMPGLGSYLITAIRAKNVNSVMGATTIMAVSFCLVMLLVDLLYAAIDPRIKAKYSGR